MARFRFLDGRRVAFAETGLMPIGVGFGRFAGRVELGDLLRRQMPADGVEIILELFLVTCADDDACDRRAMEQPVKRDLGHGFAGLFRDIIECIDDAEKALVIDGWPFVRGLMEATRFGQRRTGV